MYEICVNHSTHDYKINKLLLNLFYLGTKLYNFIKLLIFYEIQTVTASRKIYNNLGERVIIFKFYSLYFL